jgi:squid-like protein
VKKAKAKPGKIFVGGLPPELEEDAIRDYFTTNFGTVAEIESPFDKERQMRKNFCFVTFEREEVLKDVLKESRQTIGGHEVDVKKANPRAKMQVGGMGGPWGGYNNFYGYGAYGGYYDYGGYYGGGWGGGGGAGGAAAGGADASGGGEAAAPGGGKMVRESGGARATPY